MLSAEECGVNPQIQIHMDGTQSQTLLRKSAKWSVLITAQCTQILLTSLATILAIPVSSVPRERGFSWPNMIKTAGCWRLADVRVETLMQIAREGLSISQSLVYVSAGNR